MGKRQLAIRDLDQAVRLGPQLEQAKELLEEVQRNILKQASNQPPQVGQGNPPHTPTTPPTSTTPATPIQVVDVRQPPPETTVQVFIVDFPDAPPPTLVPGRMPLGAPSFPSETVTFEVKPDWLYVIETQPTPWWMSVHVSGKQWREDGSTFDFPVSGVKSPDMGRILVLARNAAAGPGVFRITTDREGPHKFEVTVTGTANDHGGSFRNATLIQPGTRITGELWPVFESSDWFEFLAEAEEKYVIELDQGTADGISFGIAMVRYRLLSNPFLMSDLITIQAIKSGLHRIRVSGTGGTYTLTVRLGGSYNRGQRTNSHPHQLTGVPTGPAACTCAGLSVSAESALFAAMVESG